MKVAKGEDIWKDALVFAGKIALGKPEESQTLSSDAPVEWLFLCFFSKDFLGFLKFVQNAHFFKELGCGQRG